MSTVEEIQRRLSVLSPETVEIEDESHRHAGHEGAKSGGGHYILLIVSPRFTGLMTVARHRLIYNALGDLMQSGIHALSIKAFAPGEI